MIFDFTNISSGASNYASVSQTPIFVENHSIIRLNTSIRKETRKADHGDVITPDKMTGQFQNCKFQIAKIIHKYTGRPTSSIN